MSKNGARQAPLARQWEGGRGRRSLADDNHREVVQICWTTASAEGRWKSALTDLVASSANSLRPPLWACQRFHRCSLGQQTGQWGAVSAARWECSVARDCQQDNGNKMTNLALWLTRSKLRQRLWQGACVLHCINSKPSKWNESSGGFDTENCHPLVVQPNDSWTLGFG